jgi:LexA-binding, inner membrane-associated putative hydrolase
MMGRTHALSGWCAGLALASTLDLDTIHQAVLFAATTAGFALLPDLDHQRARATHLLGPLTRALSWLLRRTSAAVYQATRGPRDERHRGTHRHLSHTVLFAIVLGLLTAFGSTAGAYGVLAVVLFGLLLAIDALGTWLAAVAVAAAAWWWITLQQHVRLDDLSGWLGLAVMLGCITHCIGDALTESGCPFLWPLRIRGETWYELRPPALLRIRTGRHAEQFLIAPTLTLLGVILVPGVWPALTLIAGAIRP